jgi:hypothetical protein
MVLPVKTRKINTSRMASRKVQCQSHEYYLGGGF